MSEAQKTEVQRSNVQGLKVQEFKVQTSKVQWLSRDMWVIGAGFIAAMHIGKLPPTVPILQAELGIGLIQAGLLLSLVQFAGMFFALLFGSYTEKLGLKRCIVLGLGLLGCASALGSIAQSIYMLFALRILEGFGFLLITLSGPALIRKLVPLDALQPKMGLWSSYMGGGMGLGLLCTPFLVYAFNWQGAWIFFAVLSLFFAMMVQHYVPNLEASAPPVVIKPLIQATLKHPPAWILACIFASYTGQWFSLVGFLPTIYQHNHISLAQAGFLTAIVAMSNAVGTFICGLLLQQGWKARILIQTGFVVLLITSLAFYLFKDGLPFALQYGMVFCFSLFGGLVAAIVFSQVLHFAPKAIAISTTLGLVLQLSAISQFVLPPVVAVIVSLTGSWLWVGLLMASLTCLGMYLSHRLFRTQAL